MKSIHVEKPEVIPPEVMASCKKKLKQYVMQLNVENLHGVSHVQRVCLVSFHQARLIIEQGIKEGLLVKDMNQPYKHRKVNSKGIK